ncbi:MAG TPA: IS1595 family transposase [Rhizomicrobium sp.]
MNIFKEARFHDETAAREWFEAARWPNGPICPHCRSERHYPTKIIGRHRCADKACRKDFTVTTGTVMERSHAPLTHWAVAFTMGCASKKGFSAHQLHRQLGCQYKTAWFLHHRVMEAMREGGLDVSPMGGEGKIVEMDETYFGNPETPRTKTHYGAPYRFKKHQQKRPIVSLVERGGRVRSFHVPRADKATVTRIVNDNLRYETRLMTDEAKIYHYIGDHVASHESIQHSKEEYVRGDVHTNSVEGYFSVFKRGMRGVYQHCSEKHLHRYLAEFDFRFNRRASLGWTDEQRTIAAVKAAEGKRLTYHQPRKIQVV